MLISFPPDRAEVETEDNGPVLLKASGGVLPLTWLVNGAPITSDPRARQVVWQPDGSGFVQAFGGGRQGPRRPRHRQPQGYERARGDGGRSAEAVGCRP